LSILVLPLPPLLLLLLCVLPQLLREMRHMHATRGLDEQLATMQRLAQRSFQVQLDQQDLPSHLKIYLQLAQ
jgi:hypothetical protein